MKSYKRTENTIKKTYEYHLYECEGTYFVSYYDPRRPDAGYSTLEAAKEALYYAGCLDSKYAEL